MWIAILVVNVVVLALGIADPHWHRCATGHRWFHFGFRRHRSVPAHTCKVPGCGAKDWQPSWRWWELRNREDSSF